MAQEYAVSIRLTNIQETMIDFIVEPWGEIYKIEPQSTWVVLFTSSIPPFGSRPRAIEIDYAKDRITVYGWEQSTVTLFREDEEMPPDIGGPRPFVPKIPGE